MESFYFSNGLFSAFEKLQNLWNFVDYDTDTVDFFIIDASYPAKDIRSAADIMRAAFPQVNIVVFGKSPMPIDHINSIKSKSELFTFLSSAIKKDTSNYNSSMLNVDPNNRTVILLGYPMKLTPNEHRSLMLLASDTNRIFTHRDICILAFPFKNSFTKNHIAVHVCNINKKALRISGRPLIHNPHKNGYILNPYF